MEYQILFSGKKKHKKTEKYHHLSSADLAQKVVKVNGGDCLIQVVFITDLTLCTQDAKIPDVMIMLNIREP